MSRRSVGHICSFESLAGELRGKKLTYENVKRLVLKEGRFSVFEATDNDKRARIYTRLRDDPELIVEPQAYPWTSVRLRSAQGGGEVG